MHSGTVTLDNIHDTLRTISQRRRQGILEIESADGTTSFYFIQGRLVEASRSGLTPVQETAAWLNRAGYGCKNPEEYDDISYSSFLSQVKTHAGSKSNITETILRDAIRERVLETIYSIDFTARSVFTFRVVMVEAEEEYLPSISAGQLLLDFVELPQVTASFSNTVHPGDSLRVVPSPSVEFSPAEKAVVTCAARGLRISEIKSCVLLSSFQFERTVLDLIAQGCVVVIDASAAQSPSGINIEVTDFINNSIDQAFGVPAYESSEEKILVAGKRGGVKPLSWWAQRNISLLQSTRIPELAALLFFMIAVSIPFLFWRDLFSAFSDR